MSLLPLPKGLIWLMVKGVWPSIFGPSMNAQERKPIVEPGFVRRFADDESLICLERPPFQTIEQLRRMGGAGDFWERCGALDQIVPKKALVIGDFGIGSDSPIILDYSRDPKNPPVLRLRWGKDGHNEWVQGAKDFDEFARLLGLHKNLA